MNRIYEQENEMRSQFQTLMKRLYEELEIDESSGDVTSSANLPPSSDGNSLVLPPGMPSLITRNSRAKK